MLICKKSKSLGKELDCLIIGQKIKHMAITKCINHLADRVNIEAVTFNEYCSGLTGLLSEMPNVSYTWPLTAILNDIKNEYQN